MAETILALAAQNLLSPIILFFALGLLAALVRSDLSVPEAAAKALSIYLLFVIGFLTGPKGLADIESFIVAPFKGVLCLFLLDMGLVAGRGLRASAHQLRPGLIGFGVLMPVLGSLAGLAAASLIGLSPGGTVLLMTLSASASYIAVPAAMRVALPEANPSIYLTMSLGITFPFNLTLGIPLYLSIAQALGG